MFFKDGLWYGNRSGESHGGTFREVWLWAMGYGKDQAAELRYNMAKLNRLKNKSE